ncbi:hypothetical protein BDN71DRAFT_1451108 [Pleurotus eryngii]|uniref:Uncharacterized protein n=1 Tax=Pleurotus eryngii TaxID=5323 RepID=A0A9P6DEL5_PLEER|nr:hypothetical protein BDN71DRAFT_1451108 [Pleurotus eryngii]
MSSHSLRIKSVKSVTSPPTQKNFISGSVIHLNFFSLVAATFFHMTPMRVKTSSMWVSRSLRHFRHVSPQHLVRTYHHSNRGEQPATK